MADDELTQENTEKLIQFQDLTGIEDIERCRETLERHNWDIEIAVQDTFNEQEGNPSVYRERPPEPRTPPMNLQPSDQRVFTVAPRRPQGVVQWGYFLVSFPFRFLYSTLLDIIRFAFQILRPDPRRNVTDPVGDVTRFIRNFNDKYGMEHPTFYQGSYSQALNDAKRELKFLLVYLHGIDHQDTENFCRGTLCTEVMTSFVNSNMLFWACDTNSPEGYRGTGASSTLVGPNPVSQALRENTYPFLSLIVLRENRMTVVARIEGPIESGDLIQRLQNIMDDNESAIVAARADREERSFNQSLRQQQDEAYQASLRLDQEKARKKREEEDKEREEEEEKKRKKEDHSRMLQEREDRKEFLRTQIPEEPPGSHPDAIRIVLKLPHGTRIERRFLRTQSLKFLHYFAFCHEECPDDFHIVTNFPRRTLPCEPTEDNEEPISFSECGLGKNEMVFVQDNEA